MRRIQISDNAPVTNGLAELNCDMQDDRKEVRDRVTGEGQGPSKEDESWINEDVEGVNDEYMEMVQVQDLMQRPQQQAQEPLVQWERFLPYRSINILLVENDDSTCHVVSALLRNCGYEVIAVADGLQAWKLLEDLTTHIDLVLTEVILPGLSGIGLLCKIMSHKTRKNIPVIMMSPHDSMSIVFRCLSKGAVDYLVKPIRKNELKNLWQHVWRKCLSVSCYSYSTLCINLYHGPIIGLELQSNASGSESGVRTQESTKSRSGEESDNNSNHNDDEEIGTIGLNVGDGSDHGSGTQGPWAKKAMEVDNPKPTSPWEQLADPADSTCAEVIQSKIEELGNNWVPTCVSKECKRQDLDNIVMGKDVEIRVPPIPNLQLEDQCDRVRTKTDGNTRDKFPEINSKNNGEEKDKGKLELNLKDEEFRTQVVDVMGVKNNSIDPKIEIVINTQNNISKEPNEIPSLELSLKRLRDAGDIGISGHDRNVLRHSNFSAFSRYTATANQVSTGNVGSCSPLANSSEAAKPESMKNVQSNSTTVPPNQLSNGSSNSNDMGSTISNTFAKPAILSEKPALKFPVKSQHPPSSFQPEQNGHSPGANSMGHAKSNAAANTVLLSPTRGVNQQVQVQHHHHHYHHHHHHLHNMAQQQQLTDHDNWSLKNMAAAATQCGSSNALNTDVKGKAGYQNLNNDGTGSDHGSNGQNGSNAAINPRGTNMDSDGGPSGKAGTSGGIGFRSRNGVDQNQFTQREAALNKFRQKRKERCFDKKVRYQSRKKLAEQRPRIRGQFVRQAGREYRDTNGCS